MFCTSNTLHYVLDDQPLSFCNTNKLLRCTHMVITSSEPNITAATCLSKTGVWSSTAGVKNLPEELTAANRVRTPPRQGCGGLSAEGAGGVVGKNLTTFPQADLQFKPGCRGFLVSFLLITQVEWLGRNPYRIKFKHFFWEFLRIHEISH